jgi:hypothetical protein
VAYKQKVKLKIKNTIKSMPKGGTATSNARRPPNQHKTGGAIVSGTVEEMKFWGDKDTRINKGYPKEGQIGGRISQATLAKRTTRRMKDTLRADRRALEARVEAKAKKTAMRKAVVKGVGKAAARAVPYLGTALMAADLISAANKRSGKKTPNKPAPRMKAAAKKRATKASAKKKR